jgi:hypothetical protein
MIQDVIESNSVSESFSSGISNVVISNHTLVWCFRYSSVSRTDPSSAPQIFR